MTLGLALLGGPVAVAAQAAYDPMEDLVGTAKQEIRAHQAIESSKARAASDPRRQKVDRGYWQFFQARRDARPGQFCTAVFWKADRMITISGPGGDFKGALLGFVAIEPKDGFPRPDDAKSTQKIEVSLTQGADAPARVTAFNRTIGGLADEITFAVPTVDAALAGMEDRLRFRIDHGGRQVFALEWHSGLAAREQLQRCLRGETVDGSEVP
ncbi:hypothetical protein ACPOLB_25405 [Rubrivivax sp. RP6-9]|uniref:hypothetical protein n=1 Tax=Rubrivivax sp. RP6-9 TaxID=3415750 RepID=UPI003CC58800